MTRPQPRITLKIDQITSDQPSLDRATLEAALRTEIAASLGTPGADFVGSGSYRSSARAAMPTGAGPLAVRVAAATMNAVKS
jgi:hypothetical protein